MIDKIENSNIIVILGTNASGKSSVGIELAKKHDGEIISADSRQIYRGFDLSSGKITSEEAMIVPHHLIDIIDIGTSFSVADYQSRVYDLVPDILHRGHTPFIVGGTGLYIASVTKGYVLSSEVNDTAFFDELNKLTIDELWEMLSPKGVEFLQKNPSDSKNRRRLIRVLQKERNGTPLEPQKAPIFNVLQLGVTWPKDVLHRRIEERLASRIEHGMIDEVFSYMRTGGDPAYLESLGLEYKHLLWLFQGKYASVDDFKSGLAQAIKHFAKKQMTWFRRDKSIVWLDMSGDYADQASKLIESFINP